MVQIIYLVFLSLWRERFFFFLPSCAFDVRQPSQNVSNGIIHVWKTRKKNITIRGSHWCVAVFLAFVVNLRCERCLDDSPNETTFKANSNRRQVVACAHSRTHSHILSFELSASTNVAVIVGHNDLNGKSHYWSRNMLMYLLKHSSVTLKLI